MTRRFARIVVSLVALAAVAAPAWPQIAADSRDKSEKVSEVLAALKAEPGKNVADVGAGEGFYTIRIARAVAPSGRVAAVDVNEKSLEKLRATLAQENITNVDVVAGAVDDPRLSPNTFDSVLVYNTYHEMTAHEAMLKAMFAALKPGGRLVISEALHDNLRDASRAAQVKEHIIGLNFVEPELEAAGFEVIERQPDFLPFTNRQIKGGFWLIIARKPPQP